MGLGERYIGHLRKGSKSIHEKNFSIISGVTGSSYESRVRTTFFGCSGKGNHSKFLNEIYSQILLVVRVCKFPWNVIKFAPNFLNQIRAQYSIPDDLLGCRNDLRVWIFNMDTILDNRVIAQPKVAAF